MVVVVADLPDLSCDVPTACGDLSLLATLCHCLPHTVGLTISPQIGFDSNGSSFSGCPRFEYRRAISFKHKLLTNGNVLGIKLLPPDAYATYRATKVQRGMVVEGW
jgi:hypothetical protein